MHMCAPAENLPLRSFGYGCVRRAASGHARIPVRSRAENNLSCPAAKILLSAGTVTGAGSSLRMTAVDCVRRIFCLGHVRLWPLRGRIHGCIILYIPHFDTKQQCVAHWRTKK